MTKQRFVKLEKDALIVALSALSAWGLAQSGVLQGFVLGTGGWYVLDSLVAGMFFTSVFTTVPAMFVLGALSTVHPVPVVAAVGALGAMMGDIMILRFLKKHVTNNINDIVVHMSSGRMRHILKYRFARWSLVLLGALVIASPFPDELGLTLMGLSKISTKKFAVVSYAFNALGILGIAAVARSIIR